jgi:hypothetical protein
MRYIALMTILAVQALARGPVWFHAAIGVGTTNQHDWWCELDLTNNSGHPETITVAVHRQDGKVMLDESYKLEPQEKRTIRIDDPKTNVDIEDGDIPAPLWANLLVEPALPTISRELRQYELYKDQLTTMVLQMGNPESFEETRFRLDLGQNMYAYVLNISSEPVTVTMADDGPIYSSTGALLPDTEELAEYSEKLTTAILKNDRAEIDRFSKLVASYRSYDTTRAEPITINVSPFGSVRVPVTITYPRHYIVTKPKEVIVGRYVRANGSVSTFNVHSGITFGESLKQ